jgi:hypothetical protein
MLSIASLLTFELEPHDTHSSFSNLPASAPGALSDPETHPASALYKTAIPFLLNSNTEDSTDEVSTKATCSTAEKRQPSVKRVSCKTVVPLASKTLSSKGHTATKFWESTPRRRLRHQVATAQSAQRRGHQQFKFFHVHVCPSPVGNFQVVSRS